MVYPVEEIIACTSHLYCYGEEDENLVRKIEFARTLQPGEKVVVFGIGASARDCIVMGMANPDIYIFTFDYGRRDFSASEDLLVHTVELAHEYEVYNIIPWISEATEALPDWSSPIGALCIDTDGEGTGKQLERWAPFVRSGGRIFIQNYGLDKYPKIQKETDAFIEKSFGFILGKQTPETANNGPQLREVDVL